MLKRLVLGLTVANLAFFAWSHGWVGDVAGISPLGDREPRRMETQVNSHNLRVLTRAVPATTVGGGDAEVATSEKGTVCLEAGPFIGPELAVAEAAVRAALPEGSWAATVRERPGVWLVYIGRFADRDQLKKKEAELKRLNVVYEEFDGQAAGVPNLDPGLSFGRYNRLEDAQGALNRLESQRVESARIVTLTPPAAGTSLRIARADADLQTAAASLRNELKGKPFGACPRA